MRCVNVVVNFLLLSAISCGKKKDCGGGLGSNQINLHFQLPVKIYPLKDTFSVGDTIWIEQEFSDNLQNTQNNKYYTLRNFDFKISYSFIDLNQIGSRTITNPKIVVYTGSNTQENSTKVGFKYENNTYRYKAAFIAQQKGLFLLEFGSTMSEAKGSNTGVTQCENEYYQITFYNNEQANCNFEFLKKSVDKFYQDRSSDLFNSAGSYAFYVK